MNEPDKTKKTKSRGKRAFFNCPHCKYEHSKFLKPTGGKELVNCLECKKSFVLKWEIRIFIRTATFDFGDAKPSRKMEYHETRKNPTPSSAEKEKK